MKNIRNRIIAAALSAVTAASLCTQALPAFAADSSEPASGPAAVFYTDCGSCGLNLAWTLDSNGVLTIRGTGDMTDYFSEDDVPWYASASSIREVILPDGITSIGNKAFYGCSGLKEITIPNSVTGIGANAFEASGLTEITIPESVSELGNFAFYQCKNLKKAVINGNDLCIGYYAFMECDNLADVTISEGVTSIEIGAFELCTGLRSIKIPGSVEYISMNAFWQCTGLTDVTIENGVKSIGCLAFSECSSLQRITIPDSVTSIGYDIVECSAFYGTESNWENGVLYIGNNLICAKDTLSGTCKVKDGTRNIADCAFRYCENLTGVVIPGSTETIGPRAFIGCSSLRTAVISNGVKNIESMAFYNCTSLSGITVPDSVESIGSGAFEGTAYMNNAENADEDGVFYLGHFLVDTDKTLSGNYTVKNGTKVIAGNAFSYCTGLTGISIPDSVTAIGADAFYRCTSLKEVTIPDSVTYLGPEVFAECSALTDVKLGSGITVISENTFYKCLSLESISIPSGVTEIDTGAICYCSALRSVYIPASVTDIKPGAIEACPCLESITVDKNNSIYDSRDNCNAVIETKSDSIVAGCRGTVIPDTVKGISEWAFAGYDGLTEITIPDGVRYICCEAFYGCNDLTCITIPDSVVSIGDGAFEYCSEDLIIRGCNGSFAQKYAERQGITFVSEGEHTHRYNSVDVEEPTCTENGVFQCFCICGGSYFRAVSPKDHTDSDRNGICDECGAVTYSLRDAKINAADGTKAGYGSDITIRATASGVPEDYRLAIYVDGEWKATGSDTDVMYHLGEITSDVVYQVKIIDAEGNVQQDLNGNSLTNECRIICNSDIFSRIVAFFRSLFGITVTKTIQL